MFGWGVVTLDVQNFYGGQGDAFFRTVATSYFAQHPNLDGSSLLTLPSQYDYALHFDAQDDYTNQSSRGNYSGMPAWLLRDVHYLAHNNSTYEGRYCYNDSNETEGSNYGDRGIPPKYDFGMATNGVYLLSNILSNWINGAWNSRSDSYPEYDFGAATDGVYFVINLVHKWIDSNWSDFSDINWNHHTYTDWFSYISD